MSQNKKHFFIIALFVIYFISTSSGYDENNDYIYKVKNKTHTGNFVELDSILLYYKCDQLSPDIESYNKYILNSIVDHKAKYIEISKDTLCYGLLRDSLNASTDSLKISFINVSKYFHNIYKKKPIYNDFNRFLYVRNDTIMRYYFRHDSNILYFMLDNKDNDEKLDVYFDYDSKSQELSNKIQINNATKKNVQVFWYFFIREKDYNEKIDTLVLDFKRNELIDNGDTLSIYKSR